jgi:predicted permease
LNDLFAVNIPVFALIAVGYGAAHFRLLDKRAAEGLSDFVLIIATPALVMRAMIGATLPDTQPWAYWGAYFIGVALVWAAAMLLAVHAHKTDYRESVVAGFSAGQSNTVLVGIPVILQAFGEAGAVPLLLDAQPDWASQLSDRLVERIAERNRRARAKAQVSRRLY